MDLWAAIQWVGVSPKLLVDIFEVPILAAKAYWPLKLGSGNGLGVPRGAGQNEKGNLW